MKIVVQCSGGIESTTLIALAVKEYGKENVFLIAFDTGSIFWKHRDSFAVKRVAANFQLQQNLFVCKMPQVDLLEYTRDSRYMDVGFLPGFKMMFNIASLAYAQRVGAKTVWIGNMEDNIFPDETKQFIDKLNNFYNETYTIPENMEKVEVCTPFRSMTKERVIVIGYELMGDLIYDTVSCGDERLSGGFNCGVCPWCTKRREGFRKSEIPDKTRYIFVPEAQHNDWPDYKHK